MSWKKINNYEWRNDSIKDKYKTSHIIIDVIDGFYYVRQYNYEEILLSSLAEGSKENADRNIKNIIRNNK